MCTITPGVCSAGAEPRSLNALFLYPSTFNPVFLSPTLLFCSLMLLAIPKGDTSFKSKGKGAGIRIFLAGEGVHGESKHAVCSEDLTHKDKASPSQLLYFLAILVMIF